MGCCCMISEIQRQQKAMFEKQQQVVAKVQEQRAQAPFQLGTGETFIPMNQSTGEFPQAYPHWLSNYATLTNDVYVHFIQNLNAGM